MRLSELLPPFAESVVSLINYVKDDIIVNFDLIENLAEISLYQRKLLESVSENTTFLNNELDRFKKSNVDIEEMQRFNEEFREITEIGHLSHEAVREIGNGVSTLLYLILKEKDVLERLKDKDFYEPLFGNLENPNVDQAIDNLYEGSKKLVEIIDKVIE